MQILRNTKTWVTPSEDVYFFPTKSGLYPNRFPLLEEIRSLMYDYEGFLHWNRFDGFLEDGRPVRTHIRYWLSIEHRDNFLKLIAEKEDQITAQDDHWRALTGVVTTSSDEIITLDDIAFDEDKKIVSAALRRRSLF